MTSELYFALGLITPPSVHTLTTIARSACELLQSAWKSDQRMVRMRRPLVSVTSSTGKHCLLSVAAKCMASERRSHATGRQLTPENGTKQLDGEGSFFLSKKEKKGLWAGFICCFSCCLIQLFIECLFIVVGHCVYRVPLSTLLQ